MNAGEDLGGRSVCIETATLKLEGAASLADFERVRSALAAIRGVVVTALSLSTGELTLRYDQRRTKPEELRAAVCGAGFSVQSITLLSPDPSQQVSLPWE